jgi:hypothetical protein
VSVVTERDSTGASVMPFEKAATLLVVLHAALRDVQRPMTPLASDPTSYQWTARHAREWQRRRTMYRYELGIAALDSLSNHNPALPQLGPAPGGVASLAAHATSLAVLDVERPIGADTSEVAATAAELWDAVTAALHATLAAESHAVVAAAESGDEDMAQEAAGALHRVAARLVFAYRQRLTAAEAAVERAVAALPSVAIARAGHDRQVVDAKRLLASVQAEFTQVVATCRQAGLVQAEAE